MPMSKEDYEAKRQARIDRLHAKAEKAAQNSKDYLAEADRMAKVIPFGQPILVGHYSEKSDRNYRARIHKKMDKFCEEHDKAIEYRERAEAAEKNTSISSDDPEAVTKLKEKIEKAERLQGIMKAANQIFKKKGMDQAEKVIKLTELGMSESTAHKLFLPDFAGRIGFASYQLTNNNANIRRMKQRLEDLENMETSEYKETNYEGFRVVENTEINRIQIFFDDIPGPQIRRELKSRGFRFSRYNDNAWQRHLNNNGRWAMKHFISAISN